MSFFLPRFAMMDTMWLGGHLVSRNADFQETSCLPHGDTSMLYEALLRHRRPIIAQGGSQLDSRFFQEIKGLSAAEVGEKGSGRYRT